MWNRSWRLTCEKQGPSGCSPKPRRVSKGMRLFVTVQDDEIVVTSDTGLVDTVVLLVAEAG